jgi:hypothetical protein
MITFPPDVDARAVLLPLRHGAFHLDAGGPGDEGGSDYRRRITRRSPTRFALTYLRPYVRHQITGEIEFSPFHIDMARRAQGWIDPVPARDVHVAPRNAAKTMWQFLILPAWALAHRHRRSFLAFSLTADQAELHLQNLRQELRENQLLLADFPELVPRRGSNTKRTVLTNGASFAARGLTGSNLGHRIGADRPDLLVGDDLEPDPASHTPKAKRIIEDRLINSVLPMGAPHAVVQVAGTTTMHGSLIHEAVQHALGEHTAPWIAGHGFRCHYWPPILDEGTPAERSLWPSRWSLDELHEMRRRSPQTYALNMANRPEQGGIKGYWTRELITYDPRLVVTRRILYVDPAMEGKGKNADRCAVVMAGLELGGRRVVIEYVALDRFPGVELREMLWKLSQAQPETLHEWHVEANQGGERWRGMLSPQPPGVRLELHYASKRKDGRIITALTQYQRGAVVHHAPLPALEEQQLAWTPSSTVDDGVDAVAGALDLLLPSGATYSKGA